VDDEVAECDGCVLGWVDVDHVGLSQLSGLWRLGFGLLCVA
jgi:hypothetical protein